MQDQRSGGRINVPGPAAGGATSDSPGLHGGEPFIPRRNGNGQAGAKERDEVADPGSLGRVLPGKRERQPYDDFVEALLRDETRNSTGKRLPVGRGNGGPWVSEHAKLITHGNAGTAFPGIKGQEPVSRRGRRRLGLGHARRSLLRCL